MLPSSFNNQATERRKFPNSQPLLFTAKQKEVPDTERKRAVIGRYEKDRHADRVTRIYPKEIFRAQSPPENVVTEPSTHRSRNLSPTPTITTSPVLDAATTSNWQRSTDYRAKALPINPQSPRRTNLSIAGSPPRPQAPRRGQDGRDSRTPPFTPSPPSPQRALGQPDQRSNPRGSSQISINQQRIQPRRPSLITDPNQRPFSLSPPLPHLPQPHFLGAPEIDFLQPRIIAPCSTPGENGYYCGFDSLRTCGDSASASTENVLFVGFEGGLDVFRIGKDKFDLVGRIDGLMGGVIGAKILPCTFRADSCRASRPLVALIVHGPLISEATGQTELNESTSDAETEDDNSSVSGSNSTTISQQAPLPTQITHYQTSVQVFSLKTAIHISTLFKCPPVPIQQCNGSTSFNPPKPTGDLKIAADGIFVTVASGFSGEIFIFAVSSTDIDGFRCIGKVWTTVQSTSPRPTSVSSNPGGAFLNGVSNRSIHVPVLSLSHRWLAVAAPSTSQLSSLEGTALLSKSRQQPPGLTTHSAPLQPSPNSILETPNGKSLFNRMARDVTQEFVKGARWVSDQGLQAFQAYWKRPMDQQPLNGGTLPEFTEGHDMHFPPTHAQGDSTAVAKSEPDVVCIYDLQKLLDAEQEKTKMTLIPFAAFQTPLGCSFVSFSPSGLLLLTVNKKGDTHFVWDLMRATHGRTNPTSHAASSATTTEGDRGSRLRQVAEFTRVTEANVVDVAWTSPKGHSIAILTAKGTVHVHDIPESARKWPPARRRSKDGTTVQSATTSSAARTARVPQQVGSSQSTSTSSISSAMQAFSSRTAPLMSTFRRRSESGGSRFPTLNNISLAPTASALGAKGSKAFVAGLGKGFSAAAYGVNSLRHAGDNKLHLHLSGNELMPGCVRWLTGRDSGSIAVVAGGTVRIYATRRDRNVNNAGDGWAKHSPRTVVSRGKALEFTLPSIPSDTIPPAALQFQAATPEQRTKIRPTGFWNLKASPGAAKTWSGLDAAATAPHPLSFAEIDTNAVYQPFHADRRVSLFAFADEVGLSSRGSGDADDDGPWLFGQDIPTVKLHVRRASLGKRLAPTLGPVVGENAHEDDVAGLQDATIRDPHDELLETTTVREQAMDGDLDASTGHVQDDLLFFEEDFEVLRPVGH